MPLIPCRHCQTWVEKGAPHCFDCGIPLPSEEQKRAVGRSWGLVAGGAACVAGGLVGGLMLTSGLVPVVVTVLCGAGGYLAGRGYAGRVHLGRPHTRSLVSSEAALKRCINDLQDRAQYIWSLKTRLRDGPTSADSQRLQRQLQDLMDANEHQLSRYQARKWRVDLIRWQNPLEAWARRLPLARNHELRQWLEHLPGHLERGQFMAARWQRSAAAEVPEGRRCLTALEQAIGTARTLQQQMIARQAVLLSRSLTPTDEAFGDLTPPALTGRDLASLRAQVQTNTLFSDMDELEEEHRRIVGQQDAVREIERLMGP